MQIEKNVPMPSIDRSKCGRTPMYPFRGMEVGDSVLVDGPSASRAKCKAYNAALAYGDRNDKKFSARQEPGQPGKVRIWRTA